MIAQTEPIADRKLLDTDLLDHDALSEAQHRFVDLFLIHGSSTKAATIMGLAHPRSTGPRLRRNVAVDKAIRKALADKQIEPEQVLAELSELAYVSMSDFMDDEGRIDPKQVKKLGHLVHKVKQTERVCEDGSQIIKTEIELHDRHAALVDVGKKYRMFGGETTVNVQVNVMSDILRELAPVLKECLDPGKREYFAQAMAEIAKRNGYQTSANPKVSATVEVKVNQASDSIEREIPVIHAGTGQT